MNSFEYTKVKRIYDSLPHMGCKGLCQEACGPIVMMPIEVQNIQESWHSLPKCEKSLTCSALEQGQCSIYEQRPLFCRLWGIAQEMPCSFGCQPERQISKTEVLELLTLMGQLHPGEPISTL